MPDINDYIDGRARHHDPAVQALISNCWLGEWEGAVTVDDLENAVRIVREADIANRKD